MKHYELQPPTLLVVPGDIHAPGQDDVALDLMTRAVESTAQDLGLGRDDVAFCLTGDTFDSAGFSPHPAVRRRVHKGLGSLQAEKKAMEPWFNSWLGLAGHVHVIAGNHEAWQESDLALVDSEWHEVYGDLLKQPGVTAYAEGSRLVFQSLVVCHGHDLRGSLSQHSAASVLAAYPGQNTLYGHTHRLQSCTTPTTKHGRPVDHGAWTVGVMCRPDFEHSDRRMRATADRHQQGFGVVFFGEGGFSVELCAIRRDGKKAYTWLAGRQYFVSARGR